MRIAAAYEPESGTIFQHFGRTEFFKLYEVEDNQIVSSQVTAQATAPWPGFWPVSRWTY